MYMDYLFILFFMRQACLRLFPTAVLQLRQRLYGSQSLKCLLSGQLQEELPCPYSYSNYFNASPVLDWFFSYFLLSISGYLWVDGRHCKDTWVFFLLYKFLETFLDTQLNYLEIFLFFKVILLSFVRWIRALLRAVITRAFNSTIMTWPFWMPYQGITRFFKSSWWEQALLLPVCEFQALFPLIFSDSSFLSLW